MVRYLNKWHVIITKKGLEKTSTLEKCHPPYLQKKCFNVGLSLISSGMLQQPRIQWDLCAIFSPFKIVVLTQKPFFKIILKPFREQSGKLIDSKFSCDMIKWET